MLFPKHIFHIDNLSLVMIGLVGFVALCVASFASRYLRGDRHQTAFYINLAAMLAAVFTMVSADHILLILVAWLTSNLFLARLMRHKKEWKAATASYALALKNFALGFIFLASGLFILYSITGETSIQAIVQSNIETQWLVPSSLLILLAAMTQSSLFPFHRWLTSSLNSPTPVSAIMHAGLVNGGGFLLARFAPLIAENAAVLNLLFVLGISTACLGTLWKLIQSDVKRMLACSTMGQMGFMFAQCGLGLFPAAVAHLCWHGLFKAYLFLASGSVTQEKRLDLGDPPLLTQFFGALLCGLLGGYCFTITSHKHALPHDTTLFLIALAIIAATQFALPIMRAKTLIKFPLALGVTSMMGALYGSSVYLIEGALAPLGILHPQPLNSLHAIALLLLLTGWLVLLFSPKNNERKQPTWALKTYVKMLNASQPDSRTITTHRNDYTF